MHVSFVCCHREIDQSVKLAEWISELGGVGNHNIVVCLNQIAAHQGHYETLSPILSRAFKTCSLFVPHDQVEIPWNHDGNDASSPNHAFKRVAQHFAWNVKQPYLWMEMDAIPLKSSWLDDWEREYMSCGQPFMGGRIIGPGSSIMTGIGIYPAQGLVIAPSIGSLQTSKKRDSEPPAPFDFAIAKEVVPRMHETRQLQHIIVHNGQVPNWNNGSSPEINPNASLFHRCKDESLINFLRGKRESVHVKTPSEPKPPAPVSSTQEVNAGTSATSIADQIREHVSSLERIIDGKTGRRDSVRKELRRLGFGMRGKHAKK